MQEFILLLAIVAVLGIGIYSFYPYLDRGAWVIEQGLNLCANGLVLFVMIFVVAEVVLRTMFNWPIPGHLEMSELIAPGVIFLALAYTQSTDGHVRMTLVIDLMPERYRRYAEVFNLILSLAIYSVLTYFSARHTHRTWLYGDTTMQYLYVVWPSTMAVTIGLFFTTLRLYLDLLQSMFPGRIKRVTAYNPSHLGGE